METPLIPLLFCGGLAGMAGAFAMNFFMRAVSAQFSRRVDMVRALGSLVTGKLEGAQRVGTTIHTLSGLFFGAVYFVLFALIGFEAAPRSALLGLGFGFLHGLVVSYGLMFVVSEKHPVEAYRQATLSVGLLHLLGHMLYGLVTGIIGGLLLLGLG
jgi:hypothetical protein